MNPAEAAGPEARVGQGRGRLYAELCAAIAGGAAGQERGGLPALSAAEWEALAGLAVAEGVGPLLHWRLRHSRAAEEMPRAARERLARAYYDCAARNQVLFGELEGILAALGREQTPVVLLKGADLARRLYPDPATRPMNDIDLLAPQDCLVQAAAAIQSAGYRQQKATYHLVFQGGPQGGVTVELHWSLIGGGGEGEAGLRWLWEGAEAVGGQRQALRLSPSANLLYLAGHLALQHGLEGRLIWFYDLHLLLERQAERLDLAGLARAAGDLGWEPAVGAVLRGVRERFGTRLPDGLLEALGPRGRLPLPPAEVTRRQALRDWTWQAFRSLPARDRLSWLGGFLFPTPAYMRWRYHLKASWLWPGAYLVRWVELAARAARGRGKD